jgi:O-antigen ligase
MPENIKILIVILGLAVPAFYTGQQVARSVKIDREFVVWRNVWFAVTIVAFLSLNFFVHALMLVIVRLYVRSVRAAPIGLFFILLLAVPTGNIGISGGGIVNFLIYMNNPRLLAILFLVPVLLTARGFGPRQLAACAMPDRLVLGFVLLSTALQFRASDASVTGVLRSATISTLDVLIPYFAFSRTVTSVADVRKVFCAIVVAVLPLSLIAVFELLKRWHLYYILSTDWGIESASYAERGGMLRASASAVDSITLGFVILVAVGCLLGIWQTIRSSQLKGMVSAILITGLVSTLARGPWVGAAVLLLTYFAIGPNAVANLGRVAVIGIVGLALLSVTPVGSRLIEMLPFVGSTDQENVTYRQKLFENSIVVVQRNPVFGSPDFRKEPEMHELTQGEGIMDIVNTYVEIAMKSGLVGLTLFVGFFASILLRLRRVLKFRAVKDVNFNACVRASIAILIGMLVTIATVSSIDFIPYVYWSFAGLSVSLIRIAYREQAEARATLGHNIINRAGRSESIV